MQINKKLTDFYNKNIYNEWISYSVLLFIFSLVLILWMVFVNHWGTDWDYWEETSFEIIVLFSITSGFYFLEGNKIYKTIYFIYFTYLAFHVIGKPNFLDQDFLLSDDFGIYKKHSFKANFQYLMYLLIPYLSIIFLKYFHNQKIVTGEVFLKFLNIFSNTKENKSEL